jgi:hypothetical protein
MKMTVERDRALKSRYDARIQDEAFLANQIREQTGCTRDEALTAAARIVAKDHARHF